MRGKKMGRVYNFSAGPAVLPEEVLKQAAADMLDYNGAGMSVMEMSHRSAAFQEIIDTAEADLRDLMGIPDNYHVLFMQGGATLQFAGIPMNLTKNGKADYIVSGSWSKKAAKEAKMYTDVNILASSEDKNFSYVPDVDSLKFNPDADYVYICQNETIYGTKYSKLPETGNVPLVSDVSSMFLSEPIDVSKYGLIYGGVQKNVGPAGVCIVIVRDDLVREDIIENTPTYMRYTTQVAGKSMHNTPPCWGIYICGLVFKWIKNLGGLSALQNINEEKAAVLYDFLDSSKLFKATADSSCRSIMNVPFVTGSDELDKLFIAGAKDHNIQNIKGHRSVGGMRASIYNAMPIEGVRALVEYMKEFEAQNA
jgi:phosphoserine aminotransferase